MFKKGLLIVCAMAVAACSDSGGGGGSKKSNSTNPWSSYSVATAADMPACSGDIIGRLYYIEADNEFQVCKTTGWTTIDVSGSGIKSIVRCSKVDGGVFFKHIVTTFANNDVNVSCSIWDDFSQYDDSVFYKSTQAGATNQICVLGYDVDTFTSGWWGFENDNGTKKATYSDPGSTAHNSVVTFASGDCTTY